MNTFDFEKVVGTRSMPTLKPCPFCGGKAIVVGKRHIHCGNEHCLMVSVWAKAETHALAVECWNTRANDKE